jgi:soluble lytic murein transglycosylase-like protein
MLKPLPLLSSGMAMIQQGSISRMLQTGSTPPGVSLPAIGSDQFQLVHPSLLMSRSATPIAAPPISFSNASQQIQSLGQKYGVPFKGGSLDRYQSEVIKAIIKVKAREKGIPEKIALGMAGNESGWKMWSNVEKGTLVQGRNVRDGVLSSTDWGVMQINDKAHGSGNVFPRVKYDLEYNIDYGLSFLARQRQKIRGDLGLGLGDWDRTVASYNLGHDPKTTKSLAIAQRYVTHVSDRAQLA